MRYTICVSAMSYLSLSPCAHLVEREGNPLYSLEKTTEKHKKAAAIEHREKVENIKLK